MSPRNLCYAARKSPRAAGLTAVGFGTPEDLSESRTQWNPISPFLPEKANNGVCRVAVCTCIEPSLFVH